MSRRKGNGEGESDPASDDELVAAIHELSQPTAQELNAVEAPLGSDFERRMTERLIDLRRPARQRVRRWAIFSLAGSALVAWAFFFVAPVSPDAFELEVIGGDRAFRGEVAPPARVLSPGSALELRVRPRAEEDVSPGSESPRIWLQTADELLPIEAAVEIAPRGAMRWRLKIGRELPVRVGRYQLRIVFPGGDPADVGERWQIPYRVVGPGL
ncbi:MAG: hypothetical protein AAFP04_13220 [Myxococcota bacterium]